MDRRCVYYRKPLLESGTLGTKGNVQVRCDVAIKRSVPCVSGWSLIAADCGLIET